MGSSHLDELNEYYVKMVKDESITTEQKEFAEDVAAKIDKIMDDLDSSIVTDPQAAFSQLLLTVSYLNAFGAKNPFVLKHLEKWAKRLKKLLDNIANKIDADGFSIGVSTPFSVSISVSFKAKP